MIIESYVEQEVAAYLEPTGVDHEKHQRRARRTSIRNGAPLKRGSGSLLVERLQPVQILSSQLA